MPPKTPQFDTALDAYFAGLKLDGHGGQRRTCAVSGEEFYVRPEDIAFYKQMRVPPPTLSPTERIRRKLAFLPYGHFFHVRSAHSGKTILSQYPPSTPFPIYEHQIWFGNGWDPTVYAHSYDHAQPFFAQFDQWQRVIPRPNLNVDKTNVNSEYTSHSSWLKDCYLVFGAAKSEGCSYGDALINCRDCIDCATIANCDSCYDALESDDCWKCAHIAFSKNCRESTFLYDCRGCTHCFGCTNLRNKSYFFFNEQLTREAYEKHLAAINLGDRAVRKRYAKQFAELVARAIHKENRNDRALNSFGEYLRGTKNGYMCFHAWGGEDIAYCAGGINVRDSYDIAGGQRTEFSYDSFGGTENYNMRFCAQNRNCTDIEYSIACQNCRNCFSSIGLRNKSFCIFNKQYNEDEYWRLVDTIKTQMLERVEYGEFFPPQLTQIPYNFSLATAYEGYDDIKTAQRYGYAVKESLLVTQTQTDATDVATLPADIADVTDDIIGKPLRNCAHNRDFIITRSEFGFYRKHGIPLPLHHPLERLQALRRRIGPVIFRTYERPCARCGKTMQTTYAPTRPEIVWCEGCYNSEIA